jgi:drug/metabolite transporter (DMT)-like permease
MHSWWLGLGAALLSAVVGGVWQIMTRQAAITSVHVFDLALLRYGVPAVLLSPWCWRHRQQLFALHPKIVLTLFIGAGLPFGFLVMLGAQHAPTSHMAVLVAGTSPLLTCAGAWWVYRQWPLQQQLLGLAMLTTGILMLGLAIWKQPQSWVGDVLFLLAAVLWSAFALAMRRADVPVVALVAAINAISVMLLLTIFAVTGYVPLKQITWPVLIHQLFWQGLMAGVVALWLFAYAAQKIGASTASAAGALAMVVSSVGGWWWLHESLTPLQGFAICMCVLGVLRISTAEK